MRFSPSGASETVLKRERGGLPQKEMNLAVAPEGSFWLFGAEGLAWKFAPDGAVLFASGSEQRPQKITAKDLHRQVEEAWKRKQLAIEAKAMAKAEAGQKELIDKVNQMRAQERAREKRDSIGSLLFGIIVVLVFLAVMLALR